MQQLTNDIVGGKKTWRTMLAGAALQAAMNMKYPSAVLPGRNVDRFVSSEKNNKMPAVKRSKQSGYGKYNSKRQLYNRPAMTSLAKMPSLAWPMTPATTKVKRKRYSSGYMAGKKITKRKYRTAKRWRGKFSRGVNATYEKGGQITALYTAYIGHSTGVRKSIFQNVWRAIIKRLMELHGAIRIVNFQDVFSGSTRYTFAYRYQAGPASTAITTVTYVISATDTFDSIAAAIGALFNTTLYNNPQAVFQDVYFYDNAAPEEIKAMIQLKDLVVQLYIKSSLKMQNRSIIGTDDNADQVDNVPLFGKSYYGVGTGFVTRDSARLGGPEFIVDTEYGHFDRSVSTRVAATQYLCEPPEPKQFMGAVKYGKINLNPGGVKTDTLFTSKTLTFNGLVRIFAPQGYSLSQDYFKFGKAGMFCFEKILETENPPTQNIIVAYEHNIKMSVNLYEKKRSLPTEFFQVG